jgi:fatty-acid peroxygenase
VFRTRLGPRPVICMRGVEAATMFYAPGRFTRKGAVPPSAQRLLQDKESVQLLDGQDHMHRKAMFMSLMNAASVARLADRFEEAWAASRKLKSAGDPVVLHDHARLLLTEAVCSWSGIPMTENQTAARAREFAAMIDNAARFGPHNWAAQLSRRRTEQWAQRVIRDVRDGAIRPPDGSAAAVVASHRDLQGNLLDQKTAAVELINILRPTVAVGRFIVFAAHALEQHPDSRAFLNQGQDADLEAFAQEVRRYYPFFPAVAGRVREEFSWRGDHFARGQSFLLDLYGTNHDRNIWNNPESFQPERFRTWNGDPNTLIPQGGGDARRSHRCPGDRISVELMKRAVSLLAQGTYTVPAQDLTIDLSKVPALPRTGLILRPGPEY